MLAIRLAEAEAWEADLLVVGTHGSVLLGSQAEAILRDASCDVLAIPARPSPLPKRAGPDASGVRLRPATARLPLAAS